MKALLLITTLLACGGCVESTFCLSRGSALPQGLRADEEAQRVSTTASRIELWFYTYDPPTLKFFAGADIVLVRHGSDSRTGDGAFSVRFNGVDSTFRRVASPNVVAVDERSDGSSRDSS
jgi:hypothetical protein